jgi:hypothetical protein
VVLIAYLSLRLGCLFFVFFFREGGRGVRGGRGRGGLRGGTRNSGNISQSYDNNNNNNNNNSNDNTNYNNTQGLFFVNKLSNLDNRMFSSLCRF